LTSPEVKPTAPPGQKNGVQPSASPQTQARRCAPTAPTVAANCIGFGTAYFTPTTFGAAAARREREAAVTPGSRT
jgi:hypothetical protein